MPEEERSTRSHWPIVILSTFSTFFTILLPLVLVRLLSQEEVGDFKIFFLYLTIVPAFSFSSGLMSGIAYWAGQSGKSRAALCASSTILLILAAAFSLISYLFRHQIADLLDWGDGQALYFSLALFGAIAAPFFEEAAIATGRIWTGALFYSGFEFIRAAAILWAAFQFRSITAILLAHTLVVTIKVLIGYAYGAWLGVTGVQWNSRILKGVVNYAWPVSLAWIFGIFVNSADQFILSTRISSADFAIYSIGCLSLAPLLIYEHSVTRVLIPQMSSALSQNGMRKAAGLYKNAVKDLAFLLVPSVFGLIVFATPIIEILFTPQYAEAAKYLQFYALTYLFLLIPYDALARSKGHSRWILKTFMIFASVSLLLAYLLSARWGPMGALSAVLLTGAGMRLYSLAYFKATTGLKAHEFLPFRSVLIYCSVCLVLSLVSLAVQPLFRNEYIWFAVCGSVFSLMYFAAVFACSRAFDSSSSSSVLILTQSLEIGGLERMVLQLASGLNDRRKWQVHVMAYDQNEKSTDSLIPAFTAAGIPVEAFRKRRGFSPAVVFRILRSLARNRIKLIHTQDLGCLIYALLAKAVSLGRIAVIHTQHSFIHLERKSRYKTYERLVTRFVDTLTVVSEDTKRTYLEMGFSPAKIHLIENGVSFPACKRAPTSARSEIREHLIDTLEDEEVKEQLSRHQDAIWLLYIARFFPGKGQLQALDLWDHLPEEERKKAVFCFVGPESQEGQYKIANVRRESCKDRDRILFLGASPEPQLWLNAGDIFISASQYEGMPLGPLEAIGSGMPVLLSEIAGHEFLRSYADMFSLDRISDGARSLQKIMQRISSNESAYLDQLWRSGRILRENYSVERMCLRYSALYSEQLQSEKGSLSFAPESHG